jgi:hypothetical protein
MMPKLRNLLRAADVAPLSSSMSPAEAQSLIGSCEGKYEYDDSLIEKHGQFQLEFRSGKLVVLNWILGDSGKSGFRVTEGVFDTSTTIGQFLDYCDEMEMPWTIDRALTFDRQLSFRTCESVVVTFDLGQRELQRISVSLA